MAQESKASLVGQGTPRVDGRDKVTGAARYIDDIALPGMLHGATLRSRWPHARLVAIELDPDFDWSDVTVVTAQDIPGRNTILLIEEDQPCLVPVGGIIRHVDEPIALVAAPTRDKAIAALAHCKLEVEELPALLDPESALQSDVRIYGDDNVFKTFHIVKGGDVASLLKSCETVIEGSYRTPAQEQMYIEPQGMISAWDGDVCQVLGSMQCPFYVHKALVELLGLQKEQLVIQQAVTGGGFGGKEEYPSMIAGHAALLARKAGKPVKLVYDREEDIAATTKRHPSIVKHRMGFDASGKLIAVDVDVILDGGAYLTLSPVVLSRGVLHAAGPYRCDNVKIRGRAVATHTPPHGAFRGFGAPQTTFAYERQMDKAAAALGKDPAEFRLEHCLRLGDSTATSQVLDSSVASETVIRAVLEKARPLAVSGSTTGGAELRRGRGVAFYFHGAGFTGSGEQRLAGRATVALANNGHFEVRASSTDIGQGATTMFAQIAATALGVDLATVEVVQPSTDRVPDSGPTVASRTCMIVGRLVERAAGRLRERVLQWATDNGFSDTSFEEAARAMAKVEVDASETAQYEPPPGIEWDDDTYTGSAYPCYGWAFCLVDVAVNMDTYEVAVEQCVHAVDVGKAINPVIVRGQIEGGTVQALGWALWEDVKYESGRVANRRMTNCIVPTFPDAPEMTTITVEEPYAYGPHGAKGVGEIPMDGPAAAVANAVAAAIGMSPDSLPVSPESIASFARSQA
jgi:CO/xanthine dehydrogenase Mo-binding subunit